MSDTFKLTFYAFLLIILVAIIFVFAPQILALSEQAKQQILPPNQTSQVIESNYRSLGIAPTDSPEVMIYRLFLKFDPLFVNEKDDVNSIILYNPFILNLKGREYSATSTNILINMTMQGVRNFSNNDTLFQVGYDGWQPVDCDFQIDGSLDFYNNDCWTSNEQSWLLDPFRLKGCKIFVKDDGLGNFNGRVKIRVGWYNRTSYTSLTGRKTVDVAIAICDDYAMLV